MCANLKGSWCWWQHFRFSLNTQSSYYLQTRNRNNASILHLIGDLKLSWFKLLSCGNLWLSEYNEGCVLNVYLSTTKSQWSWAKEWQFKQESIMCPTHLKCNQDKAGFFHLKQYTKKVNPFQCMFLVLLEGKHTHLQSCVIKPFETETRLYLNGHNSCNIPSFHNSQSENAIIKMKCCGSPWGFFIVNTTDTWHLTHYVLFKDNTCLSQPTIHISSYRILSLCHKGCKVQEKIFYGN